jgi:hypothetical protein
MSLSLVEDRGRRSCADDSRSRDVDQKVAEGRRIKNARVVEDDEGHGQ